MELITEEIKEHGIVSIDELTARAWRHPVPQFAETCMTLKWNTPSNAFAAGQLPLTQRTSYEPPFEVRKDFFLDEKQRIASAAVELVQDNETLLLDSGTTVYELFPNH